MALIVGAILAVISIAILAYPFLKARFWPPPEESTDRASADTPGPEAIYGQIRTLRLEYQLDKIPEDVFQEQMRAYRVEAAVALREQAQAMESALPDGPFELDTVPAQSPSPSSHRIPAHCPRCRTQVGRGSGPCPVCDTNQAVSQGDGP